MKKIIAYIWSVLLVLSSMVAMAEVFAAAITDDKVASWAIYVCIFNVAAFILGVGFGLYETLLE